jgi:hypothetical protein
MSKIEVNAIEPQSGTTLTLGASGDTVALAAGALQSGFGRSGSVNWDTTPKTSGFTAVSGNGYFVNTTSAAITVTLPATPAAGDIVAIADYANTSATNNITVGRNGSLINGESINGTISINGQVYTLVYVDATEGWKTVNQTFNQISPTSLFVAATGGTVLTCGNFKTHVFTGPGTFTVSCAGNSSGSNSVEYLVVAGGGGGGVGFYGAGAGAGGFRQNYPSPTTAGLPVTATGYPITVGAGTAGSTGPLGIAANARGTPSIFSTITSTGGGGGGNRCTGCGQPGGSGGGRSDSPPGSAGTGNTPPVSPPQGNSGGSFYGGGGGGASAVGGCQGGAPPHGGIGGIGTPIATAFFGPTSPSYGTSGPAPGRYFAGGGAGGTDSGTAKLGGSGGGGSGGTTGGTPSTSGTTNTGGGGGGGGGPVAAGGAGGSGIVVIRYKFQ